MRRSSFAGRAGSRAGTTVREIAGAIDLLPTLTSLAGISRVGDKPLDGKDISPLLLGTAGDWPDRMIFSHQNGKVSVRTQQYRLDDRGALFDMIADPGQSTNIARQQPEVAAKLKQAVAAWREEVLPKGPDERPFPVGYRQFPMTPLPARDGVPHGGVRRSASAPNCSYFVNWTSPDDRMTWDIEVHTAGQYDVAIDYTCPPAEAGSTIELSFNGSKLQGQVAPAWDPPLIDRARPCPTPGRIDHEGVSPAEARDHAPRPRSWSVDAARAERGGQASDGCASGHAHAPVSGPDRGRESAFWGVS